MIYLATYIGLLLIAIAGFSDAIIDTILFHYDISKFKNPKFNQSFWNNTISWRNKYKNQDEKQGAKFIGSTTVFVMFTDAFHLFKFIRKICLFSSVAIISFVAENPLQLVFILFIYWIFFGLIFSLFFEEFKIKK